MKTAFIFLSTSIGALLCNSCMQQTVRDSRGDIIYQEDVIGTPWQSSKTTRKQVAEREAEMNIR